MCVDLSKDEGHMETVKLTFKVRGWTADECADLIKRLYSVGALKCEPSGEGSTYIVVATFPAVCHYDGDEG